MHNHNYESIIYTEPGNANKLYFSNFEHFDINYMESTRNKYSFLIRQKPKTSKIRTQQSQQGQMVKK